jgi:preprotein translocase subunit SecB
MHSSLEMKYLNYTQIDKQKWDFTIENSPNGLVYALSWYLDIVSPNWNALVTDEYEIIMPLPSKIKFGNSILYQPIFAHQLGIFSINHIEEEDVDLFISEAIKNYKFTDIKLNNQNPAPQKKHFNKRQTQTLDLNKSYSEIALNYNRSLKSNLAKSKKTEFIFTQCENAYILIHTMREMYNRKNVEGVKDNDFKNLTRIIDYSIAAGIGKMYCVNFGDKVCSIMFVLTWQNRAYTFYGTSALGREKRSLVSLMDYYIQKNAGKKLVLDFCGSNIPGVAKWNFGFGAQNQFYYGVHLNNLPLWLKWIKSLH